MSALTGREASVLALLAQSPHLERKARDRIIGSLDAGGEAYAIAQVMIGKAKDPTEEQRKAADGYLRWASEMSERKAKFRTISIDSILDEIYHMRKSIHSRPRMWGTVHEAASALDVLLRLEMRARGYERESVSDAICKADEHIRTVFNIKESWSLSSVAWQDHEDILAVYDLQRSLTMEVLSRVKVATKKST